MIRKRNSEVYLVPLGSLVNGVELTDRQTYPQRDRNAQICCPLRQRRMAMIRALQNFLLPTSKMSYGLVPKIFKVVWAWLRLILSFFPFVFFLSSLFFLFFHFYSLSLLSPIFSLFFLSPPCLQNEVGAYERRSLAQTLCRALPHAIPGAISLLNRLAFCLICY